MLDYTALHMHCTGEDLGQLSCWEGVTMLQPVCKTESLAGSFYNSVLPLVSLMIDQVVWNLSVKTI